MIQVIFISALFFAFVGSCAWLMDEFLTAPLGWQDDDGWHAGTPDEALVERVDNLIAATRKQLRQAAGE